MGEKRPGRIDESTDPHARARQQEREQLLARQKPRLWTARTPPPLEEDEEEGWKVSRTRKRKEKKETRGRGDGYSPGLTCVARRARKRERKEAKRRVKRQRPNGDVCVERGETRRGGAKARGKANVQGERMRRSCRARRRTYLVSIQSGQCCVLEELSRLRPKVRSTVGC